MREIEAIREQDARFHRRHFRTSVVPTANMYRMACKSKQIDQACRRFELVFPDICDNLNTTTRH